MRKFPDTKLIVIDTTYLAKGTSKDPQYGGDYTATGAFKDLADKYKESTLGARKAGPPETAGWWHLPPDPHCPRLHGPN